MNRLPDLLEKNRRWAQRVRTDEPDFFKEQSEGQSPRFLWIGCSDSRVPANQIVDLAPGNLFVHRNIANQTDAEDTNFQSVLQFAVQNLQVPHIIICGHYNCGGAQAVLEDQTSGTLDTWLADLKEQYGHYSDELEQIEDPDRRLNRLCELNVIRQVNRLSRNPLVEQAWNSDRELSIHGWIYNLENGIINDLDITVSSQDERDQNQDD